MIDPGEFGKGIGQMIKKAVNDWAAVLGGRIDELHDAIKAIPAGHDGADGSSVTLEDVAPLITEEVAKAAAAIPVPQDGKDGRDAEPLDADAIMAVLVERVDKALESIPPAKDGENGKDGRDGQDGTSVLPEDVLPALQEQLSKAIAEIPEVKDGADGKDGRDGTSVTLDDVLPALREDVAKAIAQIPIPQDGRDGKDGIDGTSVTLEEVQGLVERVIDGLVTKALLDFERRAQDVLHRAVAALPKPENGKDGRDAFGLEAFDATLLDDGRTVLLSFEAQDLRVVKELAFPVPIDAGFYQPEKAYTAGQGVTFGGSFWIAQKDTVSKPCVGNDEWRLAVKKGRDGKAGDPGKPGEKGMKGDPGRDGRTY